MERSTKQRAAIQEALKKLGRPLLPQELLAEAQKSVPNLSLATIYRNIKGLVADGLVEVVSLPSETDRYEIHKHHHHHFHCNSCQQVTDIDACPGDLSKLMPSGYLLEEHQITLYGRCPNCSSESTRVRGGHDQLQ
jgi:Fur family ferric uptake transcriptional regulator